MSSYASGYNNGLLLGSQGLKPLLKMVQEACNELGNLGKTRAKLVRGNSYAQGH